MIPSQRTCFPSTPIQDVTLSNESELHECCNCLDPEELIWAVHGLIRIGDVRYGDLVLDKHGRLQRVYCTRAEQKSIWELSTGSFRFGLRISDDHRCFVVRKSEVDAKLPFIS